MKLQLADHVAVDSNTVTSVCVSGLVTAVKFSFIFVAFNFKDGTQKFHERETHLVIM